MWHARCPLSGAEDRGSRGRISDSEQRQGAATVVSDREQRQQQLSATEADGEPDMITSGSFRDSE